MLSYEWHQPDQRNGNGGFDDAEFYKRGPIVTLTHDHRGITIDCEGEESRLVVNDGRSEVVLRTPEDFRAAFPDGVIPDQGQMPYVVCDNGNIVTGTTYIELEHNGWFDLYSHRRDEGENGHLDRLDYSLTCAIGDAEDLLLMWESDTKQLRSTGDFTEPV